MTVIQCHRLPHNKYFVQFSLDEPSFTIKDGKVISNAIKKIRRKLPDAEIANNCTEGKIMYDRYWQYFM